ncbi:tRNA-modifying protein YgfZ [Oryzomicrobium terrae]|uniref:tRNA-modifying protein YgfZ n=1 Tax=Oryzomicrobium terrae TaxID=1735038 RepID=A0A5C1EA85_9RHOO|nr:folate-binding protein YgfZ [Oryzomicrobium terrae]QEL65077.1 tRNA-modifying protein YgfZ [Oryzomicrobium terrae]
MSAETPAASPVQQFLTRLDGAQAQRDGRLVLDFGDARGEAEAVADAGATVVAPLTHLAVLDAAGDDAAAFLHNQMTNDINHLAPDQWLRAAWCSAKGRMYTSFVIWRGADAGTYRLRFAADQMAFIKKRLAMFVLRSKVTLADRSDDVVLFGLAGARAADLVGGLGLAVPDVGKTASGPRGEVLRLDEQRFELAVPADQAEALWAQVAATARPVGAQAWHLLDVRAGLLHLSAATQEAFVPQMANFDRVGGVSFHKGCYPGQEIVARTQYLGKVKRHMYQGELAAFAAPGTELFSSATPDLACGQIVLAAPSPRGGFEVLAVIQENALAAPVTTAGEAPQTLENLRLPAYMA